MHWNNQFSTYSLNAATLTGSYDDNTKTEDTQGYNLVTLYVEYTPAHASGVASIQLEAGPDEDKLFPKTATLDSSDGTSVAKSHIFELPAVSIGVPVKAMLLIDMADVRLRISAKETASSYGTITIIICRNKQFSI